MIHTKVPQNLNARPADVNTNYQIWCNLLITKNASLCTNTSQIQYKFPLHLVSKIPIIPNSSAWILTISYLSSTINTHQKNPTKSQDIYSQFSLNCDSIDLIPNPFDLTDNEINKFHQQPVTLLSRVNASNPQTIPLYNPQHGYHPALMISMSTQ